MLRGIRYLNAGGGKHGPLRPIAHVLAEVPKSERRSQWDKEQELFETRPAHQNSKSRWLRAHSTRSPQPFDRKLNGPPPAVSREIGRCQFEAAPSLGPRLENETRRDCHPMRKGVRRVFNRIEPSLKNTLGRLGSPVASVSTSKVTRDRWRRRELSRPRSDREIDCVCCEHLFDHERRHRPYSRRRRMPIDLPAEGDQPGQRHEKLHGGHYPANTGCAQRGGEEPAWPTRPTR